MSSFVGLLLDILSFNYSLNFIFQNHTTAYSRHEMLKETASPYLW
jgi:hypothetical protein